MATFRERRRADRVLRKTMRGERAQRERNDDKTGHSRRAPAVGRTSRILKSFNPRGGPRRDVLVRSALKGKLRHVRIFKNLRECSLSGVGQHPTWQMERRPGGCTDQQAVTAGGGRRRKSHEAKRQAGCHLLWGQQGSPRRRTFLVLIGWFLTDRFRIAFRG